MSDVFENAISAIRNVGKTLEAEIGRLSNIAVERSTELHLLQNDQRNRRDFQEKLEASKAEYLDAKRALDDAKREATKVLADAKAQEGKILSEGRTEAQRLVNEAKAKVAAATAHLAT
jgi:hypothetical protein